jgi:hypothetical protein
VEWGAPPSQAREEIIGIPTCITMRYVRFERPVIPDFARASVMAGRCGARKILNENAGCQSRQVLTGLNIMA